MSVNDAKRWVSAITAVLKGLPVLLLALFQCITLIGYPSKPVAEIEENFLKGSASFIDEAQSDTWSAGFAKEVLTPDDFESEEYFLGGYLVFPAMQATGVIDELAVRAVVLDDNSGRGAVAFAWVDCVGLMNNDIKDIRAALADITGEGALVSINVGATHCHSAVDTQGLWGYLPQSGRNEAYMEKLVEKTAAAIRSAYENKTEGKLYYSEEEHPEMFTDGRSPSVFDKNVHLFRFVPTDTAKKEIYITNFGAHPVYVDYPNSELSGDYPYYLEQAVIAKTDADFIFIQGAIGGGINARMSSVSLVADQSVNNFEKMKQYAVSVADILCNMAAEGKEVAPVLNAAHAQFEVEIDNFIFKLAEAANLCNANAYGRDFGVWFTTEIGYIEIGENIKILEVPGEVLPEIVYGGFLSADKAVNGTDYPYAALNTYFEDSDSVLVFGLCNDALGYFVPDNDYTTNSDEGGHYEETVSTGSKSASALSLAFEKLLTEVK